MKKNNPTTKKNVAILGAGLVGPFLAVLLADIGFQVTLIDKRGDVEEGGDITDRSLQLSLSKRAAFALSQIGLFDTLKEKAIKMGARCVHFTADKIEHFPYSQDSFEFLYTIPRNTLRNILIERAKESSNINFLLMHECIAINLDTKTMSVKDISNNQVDTLHFDFVVGADGFNSQVRNTIDEKKGVNTVKVSNGFSYKSIAFSSDVVSQLGLEKETVHVWPRGNAMMLALAFTDGFNSALVMPDTGAISFDSVSSLDEAKVLFEKIFNFSPEQSDSLAQQYVAHQKNQLTSLHCASWFYKDVAVLVGDAGCTVVPWYAQGVNWGFTQALILKDLLQGSTDIEKAFADFQTIVRPSSESILRLSQSNYFKLADKVMDSEYLAIKEIEGVLMKKFPTSFISAYALLAFSLLPYEDVEKLIKQQDEILLEAHSKKGWREEENLYRIINSLQKVYSFFFEKQYQKHLFSPLHVLDINKIIFSIKSMQEYIEKEFRVRHIALYGSCVYKKSYSGTDIDIWVDVAENCTLLDLCKLKLFLEARLFADVDISRQECLRKELRPHMLKESIEIF